MATTPDLMLIFEPDAESRGLLRAVADRLGCKVVEASTPDALRDVLATGRPTLAVLAVDAPHHDGFSVIDLVAGQAARPATLLVGAISPRLLASTRRTAEARGISVFNVASRPLDAVWVEQALTPHVKTPPPILAEELEQAILEHELVLQYLPKLSLGSRSPTILGVEALVRWQHPRRGLLQPSRFLGAFDDHGMMPALTDVVMTEAIRQAGVWRSQGLDLQLVVNLSPRLVRDAAFPERLATLLRENDFPPQQLVLDVIESPTTDDRDLILDVFTRLRILGVGLSLDNFGTGFSSLTEIYRMPFSEIKIDHTLLADVPKEREARVIVKAIANLARALQLNVCAEGIESWQMLEFARSAGFDTAQGRFFSDAIPAAEVEALVRDWPSAGPATPGSWRAHHANEFDPTATTMRLLALPFRTKGVAEK